MSDTEYLRRRIQATEDLHKVVKMMKSLALANVRRNEQAVEAMTIQGRTVELGLRALMTRHALPQTRGSDTAKTGLLVFGSDQGMCGPFNERIREHALNFISRQQASDSESDVEVITIGARVSDLLLEAGFTPLERMDSAVTIDGARLLVRKLLPAIEAWENRSFARIVIAHNRPTGGANWSPVTVQLLPLTSQWSEKESQWPGPSLPQWSLDDDALFAHLVREQLILTTFRAAVESLSAENASRLAAMQAAERSIGDKLDELQADLRQERQTAITLELLDLVGGYEALGQ